MLELYELYNRKVIVEGNISNYFGGDEPYYGDQGYQELLQELEDINEQIEELEDQ